MENDGQNCRETGFECPGILAGSGGTLSWEKNIDTQSMKRIQEEKRPKRKVTGRQQCKAACRHTAGRIGQGDGNAEKQ